MSRGWELIIKVYTKNNPDFESGLLVKISVIRGYQILTRKLSARYILSPGFILNAS